MTLGVPVSLTLGGARLIGSFEEINNRFDGKPKEIVSEMQNAFKAAA